MNVKQWWKRRKQRKLFKKLRADFKFFGVPLDNFSDEKIEQGIAATGLHVRWLGVSAKQAARGLARLSAALSRSQCDYTTSAQGQSMTR